MAKLGKKHGPDSEETRHKKALAKKLWWDAKKGTVNNV